MNVFKELEMEEEIDYIAPRGKEVGTVICLYEFYSTLSWKEDTTNIQVLFFLYVDLISFPH
jgi:hypothetical protein